MSRSVQITTAHRRRLISERGSVCQDCGHEGYVEADHIQAVIDGGKNSDDNLRLLCVPCHLKKHGAQLRSKDHFSIEADAKYWRDKAR